MDEHLEALFQRDEPLSGGDVTTVLRAVIHKQDQTLQRLTHLESQTNAGYPGGDPHSHRTYHEGIIERSAEIKKLRQAIQEKTFVALFFAAALWLFHTFVEGLAKTLGWKLGG